MLNWKSLILGAGVGFIGGYLVKDTVTSRTYISAERVLLQVKKSFKREGTIDGSWIHMKTEDYQKHAIKTKVYRGGISRSQNGQLQQFEFIADAYTGSVLDVYLL
jgi:predicted small secreted protein